MNALKNNPFRLLALSMTLFASATVWAGPTTEANQSGGKMRKPFRRTLVKQGYDQEIQGDQRQLLRNLWAQCGREESEITLTL